MHAIIFIGGKMKLLNSMLLMVFILLYSIRNYTGIEIIISTLIIVLPYGILIYKNNEKFNKKNIMLSVIISILLTIFTYDSFNYLYKDKILTIKNISDNNITINGLYYNDKRVKINYRYDKKYDDVEDTGIRTEYKKYNKITSSYKMTLESNKEYKFNIKNIKSIKIQFQKNTSLTKVLINNKNIRIKKTVYNYSFNSFYTDQTYTYTYNNVKQDNIVNNIIITLLSLYIYFIIAIKLISNLNVKKICYTIFPLIIELNSIITVDIYIKLVLLVLFLLLMSLKLEKEKNNKVLYLISSIFISFSFLGQRIIVDKTSFNLLFLYILLVLFIYVLIIYFMKLIDILKVKKQIEYNKNTKHRIIVFIITFSICMIYLYCFYPFIVHVDTYMQLSNINDNIFNNWHPYFHTLILKICKNVFGNVNSFMYIRIFIYSLLINIILFYFNKKGLSILKVYLISIIITLLPTTGIMLVTLIKDIDFTIALLALSYYFIIIINDYEYFNKNKFNYLFLAISLIFVATFRHNGIYITIISLIALLFYLIKNKKKLLIFSLLISIISIYLINVPLYRYLKVKNAPRNFDIATMIHGLTYVLVKDYDMDQDTSTYLKKKVYKNKNYKVLYNKYNIDSILHYNNLNIRDKKINKGKIILGYLKQWTKSPISLFKDRLYGINILWDILEKDNIMTYKYQIKYDERGLKYYDDLNIKPRSNKMISNVLLFIATNDLLNALLFRSGIFIDLLIILGCYIIKESKKNIFVFIPIITNVLTLFISMHHQSFRYVWSINLVALLILLMLLYQGEIKYKE